MRRNYWLLIAVALNFIVIASAFANEKGAWKKGYDVTRTGLTPRYPTNMNCSPLTSLYASWDDVDGSRRDEAHSGVDGGRLGDAIMAPASGHVVALWRADWGWGEEQALLVNHSASEINLKGHQNLAYYSEFDHLNLHERISLSPGDKIARGQRLASVFRPGGNKDYLPEVHWEVWEAKTDADLTWKTNKFDHPYWEIQSARLVDPLYMLSLNGVVRPDLNVDIPAYRPNADYSHFVGFTYPLPCRPPSPDSD